MSDMATIRPRLRALVIAGEDHRIDPLLWQAAYEHLRGTDITAAAITRAIAEFRRDKAELELLRRREEASGD